MGRISKEMQNDQGKIVDLYIPRKCSATNALITAFDYKSVQIEIADVDQNGHKNGRKRTVALAGLMRQRGEADACLNRLFGEMGLISFKKRAMTEDICSLNLIEQHL